MTTTTSKATTLNLTDRRYRATLAYNPAFTGYTDSDKTPTAIAPRKPSRR